MQGGVLVAHVGRYHAFYRSSCTTGDALYADVSGRRQEQGASERGQRGRKLPRCRDMGVLSLSSIDDFRLEMRVRRLIISPSDTQRWSE